MQHLRVDVAKRRDHSNMYYSEKGSSYRNSSYGGQENTTTSDYSTHDTSASLTTYVSDSYGDDNCESSECSLYSEDPSCAVSEYSEMEQEDYQTYSNGQCYSVAPCENCDEDAETRLTKKLLDFQEKSRAFAERRLKFSSVNKYNCQNWLERNAIWKLHNSTPEHFESDETGYQYVDPEGQEQIFDGHIGTYRLKKNSTSFKDLRPVAIRKPTEKNRSSKNTKNWMYVHGEPNRCKAESQSSSDQEPKKRTKFHAKDSFTEQGIRHVLDTMDNVELSKIQKDLKAFQTARRRLIFDATNLSAHFDGHLKTRGCM